MAPGAGARLGGDQGPGVTPVSPDLHKQLRRELAWESNASKYVYALAIDGNTVYVGGEFPSVAGSAHSSFAAIRDLSIPTAVQAALVRSDATADRVKLLWHVAAPSGTLVTIERAASADSWMAVASSFVDASGPVSFEDRDARAGDRLGYRLVIEGSALADAWVDVPRSSSFAFGGIAPNPTRGDPVTIVFELPDDAPARIEIFDPLGRRVFQRELAGLGAGAHRLRLDAALRAGVYLAVITHSGERRQARFARLD